MMVFDVKRPLIPDIAAAAGVSTATVDRVLNRRSGVRKVTLHRVLEAAVKVGYLSEDEVKMRLGPAFSKVVFLLPQGTNPYLTGLNSYVRALAEQSMEPLKVRSHFIESFNPEALVRALRRYGKTSDTVIFMAIEHPKVRQVIDELIMVGKRVITIISDLPTSNRHAYIGIDNFAAGRTAAKIMGGFCHVTEGKLALVAASRAYRAHMEREMGFLALAEESFPHLTVIGPHEGHDNRDENYHNTCRLLEQHPDLVGIYNVGGSSDGIGRALLESKRDKEICFIGHGLTPDIRGMLIEGVMDMVITQSPHSIYAQAIEIASGEKKEPAPTTMEIYFSENLPAVST